MRPVHLVWALACAGCVEGFRGSNLQLELSPGTPVQGRELPRAVHWKLYGLQHETDRVRLFELQRFEVQPIVDLASPCFIDVGDHVPHPGLHVSQYAAKIGEDTGIPDYMNPPPEATEAQRIDAATAAQRAMNVAALAGEQGLAAVTSASEAAYPTVDADCDGEGLPPPRCTDPASNARRLAQCQAAWRADAALFEGTDRILTSPLAGTTHGFVDGLNPISLAPVGGAQFFVDEAVEGLDEYALYVQDDGAEGHGTLMLSGRPVRESRGVWRVHLDNPLAAFSADLAIFANLGEDDVHF